MSELATLEDVEKIWRKFKNTEERDRAVELLVIVSDSLREEAIKYGKDIDLMANSSATYASVVKSVIVDVIHRCGAYDTGIRIGTWVFNVRNLSCSGRRIIY